MEPLARSLTIECPRCGRSGSSLALQRMPRRFIDRLISLFQRQHRFRCRSMGCEWEGNIPVKRLAPHDGLPQ